MSQEKLKDPGDLCEHCSAWTPERYNKCSEPCKEYTEAIREAKLAANRNRLLQCDYRPGIDR